MVSLNRPQVGRLSRVCSRTRGSQEFSDGAGRRKSVGKLGLLIRLCGADSIKRFLQRSFFHGCKHLWDPISCIYLKWAVRVDSIDTCKSLIERAPEIFVPIWRGERTIFSQIEVDVYQSFLRDRKKVNTSFAFQICFHSSQITRIQFPS
jgi:hypothetical protein